MKNKSTNTNVLTANLRRIRRKLAARSPRVFAMVYLANNCDAPFSRMHREIFKKLSLMTRRRKAKVAIAAPRGRAKSTIVSLIYVLWCLLYGKERLILIASNTTEQAIALLKDIKYQLKQNPLICSDFPEICRVKKPKPWRNNKIQLPNGAMICVYGAGQSPRGIKNDKDRPGLIICDDLEDDEKVESEEQREKLRSWFSGALLNTGHTDTNVIVVGTILHQDSLLANLVNKQKKPGWDGKLYQAIEKFSDNPKLWEHWSSIFRNQQEYNGALGKEGADLFYEDYQSQLLAGTKVLWPEREDYQDLMLLRETEGDIFFQREKQNCPLDPKRCIFKKENIQFWDDQFRDTPHLIEAVGKYGQFYGACDPSLGRTAKADYTAIIILLKNPLDKVMYVIAADILNCSPDEAIQKIINYVAMYKINRFAVESNNFQQLMVDDLQRRLTEKNYKTRIDPLRHSTNKNARIGSLEPYVSQGFLRFNSKHSLLLNQLLQFPLAKNDDGPDALEMAVEIASKQRRYVGVWPPPKD